MGLLTRVKEAIFDTQKTDPAFMNASEMTFPMAWSYDTHKLNKANYARYYQSRCYIAVSTVATGFAGLAYVLETETGKETTDYRMKLLNYNFMLNIASYLKLNWNCYIRKNMLGTKVLDLVILRPDLVKPVLNEKKTRVESYEYGQTKLPKEEVIHLAQFNPLHPYPTNLNGMWDMEAIALSIDWDRKASERNWKFFDNSARPDWVLETEASIDPKIAKELKDKWDEKTRWIWNSHQVKVLTNGLKYKAMTPWKKEMDFVEWKRLNRDEILAGFKVPKAIIWLWEGGQTLNIWKFEWIFAKQVLVPLAKQVWETLSRELFNWKFVLKFVNIVPYDQTEMRWHFVVDWITLNEFRQTIWFPTIKGWDTFRSQMIGWDTNTEAKKEFVKATTMLDDKTREWLKNLVSKAVKWLEKWSDEYNQKKREEKIVRNNRYEELYRVKLLDIFTRQEAEILKEYKARYKTKGIKATYPLLSTTKRWIVYWDLLNKTQADLVETEWNKALLEVWIWVPADITSTATRKELKDNIKKRSLAVDTTTNEKLVKQFDIIINQWLSVNEWTALLKKNVFWQLKTSRVNAIVRTETINAWNYWSELWYIQSWVVEEKERFTAQDERVCPFCWPMNWKIVWLTKTYFKKGQTISWVNEAGKTVTMTTDYKEIKRPSLHTWCRCVIIPVVK